MLFDLVLVIVLLSSLVGGAVLSGGWSYVTFKNKSYYFSLLFAVLVLISLGLASYFVYEVFMNPTLFKLK